MLCPRPCWRLYKPPPHNLWFPKSWAHHCSRASDPIPRVPTPILFIITCIVLQYDAYYNTPFLHPFQNSGFTTALELPTPIRQAPTPILFIITHALYLQTVPFPRRVSRTIRHIVSENQRRTSARNSMVESRPASRSERPDICWAILQSRKRLLWLRVFASACVNGTRCMQSPTRRPPVL